jgi:hypothetical protein
MGAPVLAKHIAHAGLCSRRPSESNATVHMGNLLGTETEESMGNDPHSGLPPDWEVVCEYGREHVYYWNRLNQQDDLAENLWMALPRAGQAWPHM